MFLTDESRERITSSKKYGETWQDFTEGFHKRF